VETARVDVLFTPLDNLPLYLGHNPTIERAL
jgi:hypothetical protein